MSVSIVVGSLTARTARLPPPTGSGTGAARRLLVRRPEARAVVAGPAREIGYDPHDAGGLGRARWLEARTPFAIALGDTTFA